jgi:hypothetical protein
MEEGDNRTYSEKEKGEDEELSMNAEFASIFVCSLHLCNLSLFMTLLSIRTRCDPWSIKVLIHSNILEDGPIKRQGHIRWAASRGATHMLSSESDPSSSTDDGITAPTGPTAATDLVFGLAAMVSDLVSIL